MKIKNILISNSFTIAILTGAFLAAMCFQVSFLSFPERKIFDLLMRARTAFEPSSVVIVGLDGKGRQSSEPWPRSDIADAVMSISEAGAQAIGLCVLFEEREPNPALMEFQELEKGLEDTQDRNPKSISVQWKKLFHEASDRLDHDARLISAVKAAHNTVLPFEFMTERDSAETGPGFPLSGLLRVNSVVLHEKAGGNVSFVAGVEDYLRCRRRPVPDFRSVRETYGDLAGKAGALGHINLTRDPDGVVRMLPLFVRYRDRWFPSISLQLAAKFKGLSIKDITLETHGNGMEGIRFGDEIIPIDDAYNMFIGYRGFEGGIQKVTLKDVLNKVVDPSIFQNKLVLIGNTSEGKTFVYQTPLGRGLTEAETLACAAYSIISGSFFSRPFWARMVEMAAVFYFALLLLFVVPKVNLRAGAFILSMFLLTWVIGAVILFESLGTWLWMLPPVALCAFGYAFIGAKKAVTHIQNQSYELNRTLGLSYQSQGLLDMAFEKFKICPPQKNDVKQLLYDLGLEFERKRMFNKALAVYEHIIKAGVYKDLVARMQNLRSQGALVLNGKPSGPSGTVILDQATVAPTFGRYEIIRELGQGAMGTVFLAKDPKIKREVAIKTLEYHTVLPEELKDVKSRFFHESETAGKLSHPHIVTIYDIGEERDMGYIAMEFLDGVDLSYHCKKENLLPNEKVLSIISDVADALHYAHQNGVVHRDIKPSNIMLLANGQVKVTDFGIARAVDSSKTRTGIVLGTPAYMSPEQVAGKKVSGSSDLFSLGIVFYELLSGERPFAGEDLASLMYAITKGEHTPLTDIVPDISPCCVEIVEKLLSKAMARRYKSANLVVTDLQNCMNLKKG